MTHPRRYAVLLFIAALAPVSALAQDFLGIEFSDVKLKAFTSVATQLAPLKTDSDTQSAPVGVPNDVAALVRARGIPFPNLPNSVGSAFASSSGDNTGRFGVGVNGFFFTNSLPPDALLASGEWSQTFTNHSTIDVSIFADISIPAPTIQLFGVGNSFPAGADPRRDVAASVNASILTKITHPNGSVVDATALDYGISLFRAVGGTLAAIDADGAVLPRFEEPDGSFGFQLPSFHQDNLRVATFGPGDVLEFTFAYFASASTGFGETGIFAAIGDPFNLSASGAGLSLQVGAPVPEPATWMLLVAGLLAFSLCARTRAVQPQFAGNRSVRNARCTAGRSCTRCR